MGGLLSDNPVFAREARWWLRGRWLRRSRSAAWTSAGIAVVVVWLYIRVLWAMGDADVESFRPLWDLLTHGLLVLIVLLGPLLASATIIREREQRTWESLALTRLRGRDILLGKWLAATLPIWLLVLVSLPLMLLICAGLNMSFEEPAILILFYLLTAAAYTLLGLFCSFVARKASVARMTALMAAFGLCFGLFIVDGLFRQFVPDMGGYSPWQTALFGGYRGYGGLYRHDYGYYGFPAITWVSPFYALSVLSEWTQARNMSDNFYTQGDYDGWSAQPSSVLLVYGVSLIIAVAFCWYYMLTRYRRDVRGGKPLGETIA